MKLVLLEGFSIRNADANFTIGEVRPTNGAGGPFRVFACVLPDDEVFAIEVAVVNSLDECLPALANYYDQNLPDGCARARAGMKRRRSTQISVWSKISEVNGERTATVFRFWNGVGPRPF
jgi:hypothetical protein